MPIYQWISNPSARLAAPAVALGFFSVALTAAAADEPVRRLSLASALEIAETQGFEALSAEAAVAGAEGDLETVRRGVNPAISGSYLHSTSVPVPGGLTSSGGYALAAADQGAIEALISGKRSLRVGVAESALAAARSNRDEAVRLLRLEAARAYYDVLLAEANERVARDVAGSFGRTLALVDERLKFGAASRVDRARVETARLEADQGVTAASADVARARETLGVWLGGRSLEGVSLDGSLDDGVPSWLDGADPASLSTVASARPDVRAARAGLERADVALDLARRERLPDVDLSAGYTRQGPDSAPVTPPTVSLGAAFALPILSQQQGEIARAESDRSAASVALSRVQAQASADTRSAWSSLQAARERVGRMRDSLLSSAREARDLVRFQYREGAVSLLDLLDAERTALQVELENAQDLHALRVAVIELEAAVGRRVAP